MPPYGHAREEGTNGKETLSLGKETLSLVVLHPGGTPVKILEGRAAYRF